MGETESHEIFESDAVLALIGILVRWIGVGMESNDVFKSFLIGLFINFSESIMFLFLRGGRFKFGGFRGKSFTEEAFLPERT